MFVAGCLVLNCSKVNPDYKQVEYLIDVLQLQQMITVLQQTLNTFTQVLHLVHFRSS